MNPSVPNMLEAASLPSESGGAGSRGSEGFRLPELLAPAGDWACVRAAVENGADAIYFGLNQFNARMRAENFTEADLPALMEFLHRRGVKGYVTFNILVFPEELAEAERFAKSIIAAGADAAIVQDVGLCRLIRRISPDFPIHASTQMTLTSARGVVFAADLGCELVVLAREVPVSEIRKIRQTLAEGPAGPASAAAALPLEVFVHGALCVAYSGQCLTSESLGGRSANRGVCAQACRMPYELVSDGHKVDLGDRRYLLSPQDLVGVEVLPELMAAGVASLKIEGRLKTPEYVANITRVYREAIDQVAAALAGCAAADIEARHEAARAARGVMAARRYDLEMAFSRGLHSGWMEGVNNQQLVHGRFGKKRGVFLGRVTSVRAQEVGVVLVGPLKPGDGVVFDAGRPDLDEQGGRVYEVLTPAGHPGEQVEVVLRFGRGDVDCRRIEAGNRLWKTSDPELDRRLRRSFDGDQIRYTRVVDIEVDGEVGRPLRLVFRDDLGHEVFEESGQPLAAADRHPLTGDRLREQLGRLGGTPFRLRSLENRLADGLILPVSELNRMRRGAVRQLEQLRARPRRWTLQDPGPPGSGDAGKVEAMVREESGRMPVLAALVRSLEQLEAVLGSTIRTVYCDFEDPKRYRDAVGRFRDHHASVSPTAGGSIYLAPPRIHKMGEEGVLRHVSSCEPDGFLVRNYDQLEFFRDRRMVGDFSLNVANWRSAEYFLTRYRLECVTASYDLDHAQLKGLLQSAPARWFEITVHQHMPMFHMEHCVFCAFLSQGTDHTNCGRPCDRHDVRLRDRVGIEHPVKADVGCRNTVFNGVAQTGAEHVESFVALGARRFRLEFVNETPAQVRRIVACYEALLRGEIRGGQLWRELKVMNQLGVTRGPMG